MVLDGRLDHAGAYPLGFLRWNLALAWVPFLAAMGAHAAGVQPRHIAIPAVAVLGAVWFAFLPNAPYIVTDVVHLREPGVVLPLDVFLIGGFAAIALALGVVSLRLMHDTVQRLAGGIVGWIVTFAAVAGAGLGVWVGRVWRWNSWDLLDGPGERLEALARAVVNAEHHARSMTLAAGVALVFFAAYVVLFAVTPTRRVSVPFSREKRN